MSSVICYIIVGISVAVRAYAQKLHERGQPGVDLGDILLLTIFAGVWIVRREDPANSLRIVEGMASWEMAVYTGLIVVVAGLANLWAHARLRQSHGEWMKGAGINPGGAYLALSGMPKWTALVLAVPFIASGALLEEIVFRGFLLRTISKRSSLSNGLVVQAVLFGLLHGIPMALVEAPNSITSYALLMPITVGLALGWITVESGGLAYPWIAHWSLNYAAFAVEMSRLSRERRLEAVASNVDVDTANVDTDTFWG